MSIFLDKYLKEDSTIDQLKITDESAGTIFHSYLSNDSLGITIEVPYVYGSYIIYEVKTNNLKKFLKIDIND